MTKPEIGMGATYSIGSDRYAYTVVEILRKGRTLLIQRDVPNGQVVTATLRGDGQYRPRGSKCGHVALGVRRTYMDPGF